MKNLNFQKKPENSNLVWGEIDVAKFLHGKSC